MGMPMAPVCRDPRELTTRGVGFSEVVRSCSAAPVRRERCRVFATPLMKAFGAWPARDRPRRSSGNIDNPYVWNTSVTRAETHHGVIR